MSGIPSQAIVVREMCAGGVRESATRLRCIASHLRARILGYMTPTMQVQDTSAACIV